MNADWLTQLAPAHAPSPPSWWPPAPGWWILFGLILALATAGIFGWRLSEGNRQRRLRREAMAELQRIRSSSEADRAREIQLLMRRFALSAYGAGAVANLSGDAWLRFLEAHGGEAFTDRDRERFLAAAYGKTGGAPDTDWSKAAERFIRHRPSKVSAS